MSSVCNYTSNEEISYQEVPQGQADPEVMYQSHEVNEDLVSSSEASLPFLIQKKKEKKKKTISHVYLCMEDGSLPDKRHTDRLILFSCSLELYILSAKERNILRHHC